MLAEAKKEPLALIADHASPMRRLPGGIWIVEVARYVPAGKNVTAVLAFRARMALMLAVSS